MNNAEHDLYNEAQRLKKQFDLEYIVIGLSYDSFYNAYRYTCTFQSKSASMPLTFSAKDYNEFYYKLEAELED